MDILTGENVSSIQVANMASFIGQFRYSRRGGSWKKGVVLARCDYHFIRVSENNLVQHPRNINLSSIN